MQTLKLAGCLANPLHGNGASAHGRLASPSRRSVPPPQRRREDRANHGGAEELALAPAVGPPRIVVARVAAETALDVRGRRLPGDAPSGVRSPRCLGGGHGDLCATMPEENDVKTVPSLHAPPPLRNSPPAIGDESAPNYAEPRGPSAVPTSGGARGPGKGVAQQAPPASDLARSWSVSCHGHGLGVYDQDIRIQDIRMFFVEFSSSRAQSTK